MKKQLIFIFLTLILSVISFSNIYSKDYSFDKIMDDVIDSFTLNKPSITNIHITDNKKNGSSKQVDGIKEFPSDIQKIYMYFKYNNIPVTDELSAKWFIRLNDKWNELGRKFLVPPLASDDGAFAMPVNNSGYWSIGKYKVEIYANKEIIGTTYFHIFKSQYQKKYDPKSFTATKKYVDTKLGVEISYPANWMLSGTMGNLELLDEKGVEKVTIRDTFRFSR